MADLLEGNTEHTHYAPLSHSQTIAISRHLQDQIRGLEAKIADLQKGLQDAHGAVSDLKDNASGANSAVHALQDGLKNTNSIVDAQRKELARTNGNVQKLQQGLEQANGNIAALKDGQTVTNTNLQKVISDLGMTHALATKLQETIERKVDAEIQQLRDDMSRTNLDLKHLRADEEAVKGALYEERERIRETNQKVKGVTDKLAETDTRVGILEQRVADNTGAIKATKQNLEDLNLAALKLHEDHENTKGVVNDLKSSVKKAHSHVKQVHENLDRVATNHAQTARRLDDNNTDTDGARQNLEDLRSKVQALKDGQDRTSAMLQHLRRELTEVGATTEKVKAGLKEQSSLLLPNLSLDSQEARAATQRHGSLLQTTPLGVSPRKPSSRGSTGRNLGSTGPNVMAWT
mmetsp:Transcript_10868/g.33976  ORF Transcript_10868/g.33976 Transcript_10868/m.33976 type:complete len:405 (-) Transcript_10868:102-1316(-)